MCERQEQLEFDFWIGDWEVRDPAGNLVGHNRISRVEGVCGLREEWRGAGGVVGTSLNIWSAEHGCWHQTWIDSSGSLLLLDGGLRDGAMVLEGTTREPDQEGGLIHHRITWSIVDG